MGQCKLCGKKGLLLTLDKQGLCNNCQLQLYPSLVRTIEIIEESQKIIKESKNWKTKLGRCDTIVQLLERFAGYEARGIKGLFNKTVPECLQEVEAMRSEVMKEAISATYEDARAKAQFSSTPRTKINACNKGILKFKELTKSFGKHPLIERAARQLKKHAHTLEFKSFVDAAQKAEFKGNFKKALDRYQEALYFLKTDEIDDSEQKETIVKLQAKIEEVKVIAETPKSKLKRPQIE